MHIWTVKLFILNIELFLLLHESLFLRFPYKSYKVQLSVSLTLQIPHLQLLRNRFNHELANSKLVWRTLHHPPHSQAAQDRPREASCPLQRAALCQITPGCMSASDESKQRVKNGNRRGGEATKVAFPKRMNRYPLPPVPRPRPHKIGLMAVLPA